MEKWGVEGNELTPIRSALNRANLELRKNKIGNIQIANLDQITARKIWSHISNVGNSNTARLVKSHCKIIVDDIVFFSIYLSSSSPPAVDNSDISEVIDTLDCSRRS